MQGAAQHPEPDLHFLSVCDVHNGLGCHVGYNSPRPSAQGATGCGGGEEEQDGSDMSYYAGQIEGWGGTCTHVKMKTTEAGLGEAVVGR